MSASTSRAACCNVSARGRRIVDRRCLLVRADANRGWPLAAGAARVIFSSRALHLFEPDHVADEVFRVAQPAGATLVIGRVERSPESIRARLADEMRRRLRRAGIRRAWRPTPSPARRRLRRAWRGAVGAGDGGDVDGDRPRPRQSLDAWRQLPGLGGVAGAGRRPSDRARELEGGRPTVFGGSGSTRRVARSVCADSRFVCARSAEPSAGTSHAMRQLSLGARPGAC